MMCATHGLSWLHIQEVKGLERAMGFEPTTSCLEGKSSTAELHPLREDRTLKRQNPKSQLPNPARSGCDLFLEGLGFSGFGQWVGRDSNPRTPKRPDLQSGAIDRSATYP